MAKSTAKLKVAKAPAKAAKAKQNFAPFFKLIKDHGVEYVAFRFTDIRGKLQHTAQHVSTVDEDLLTDGVMFDGSSIAGWKAINESDMVLMPDVSTAVLDPFSAIPTLDVFCDVYEPSTGMPYARDPRSIARAAEQYLLASGIGDTAYFGPEAEFFIFDDVRINVQMNKVSYEIDSMEGPYNSGTEYEHGNMGHRPATKGGYFPVQPIDSSNDLRAEMTSVLARMGVPMEKHHHEVAPSQVELGLKFSTLVNSADNMQLYKYVVHNVAHAYGKSATFLPKPVYGDNGSGMHVHQSVWKAGKPLFAGSGYADLSETCLYYIGGIIRHAKALNAITNPTTNSYKRLVPGYEAPVNLAYSRRNRSAAVRVPMYSASPKAKRIEFRPPDPSANPYLAFAAMMMAGLDGILNKIDPGEPLDKDIYDLSPEELKSVPSMPASLDEALDCLEEDHEFMLKGDVFTQEIIEAFISYKRKAEAEAVRLRPHPYEFMLYYDI